MLGDRSCPRRLVSFEPACPKRTEGSQVGRVLSVLQLQDSRHSVVVIVEQVAHQARASRICQRPQPDTLISAYSSHARITRDACVPERPIGDRCKSWAVDATSGSCTVRLVGSNPTVGVIDSLPSRHAWRSVMGAHPARYWISWACGTGRGATRSSDR